MNEAELVARVRELFSPRIGDDAAVVDDQVFTTDLLVEDVDFTRAIPLRFIARKSLAVNLSDLAAMGAAPAYALLSLGLPPWALENADEMLVAYAEAARQYGIEIVGGDFSRAEKLTISVTAIGRIVTRPLLRSGAKRGRSRLCLAPDRRQRRGIRAARQRRRRPMSIANSSSRPFAATSIRSRSSRSGWRWRRIAEVTACIDVSDGLSTDLHHLCDASQCGAEIEKERIPVFPDLLAYGAKFGINVQDAVLHGGEEYALLFTSSLRESELSTRLGRPVYAIGRITKERGVVLKEDGVARPLEARGWDHFA